MIGALRVNLAMDSAKFSRGMTDAQKRLKVARAQFIAVAGAATALAGGLSALTISTSRVAAEIKTMASVANAAPEELQRWAAGAATVGIEQEKLADILKDVNDRVGDFVTTGGGPMADFFENVAPKIGITADAFKNLSGPQALQLYVSSLEKAGLSQQEMTFYLEAMASDATALIPLLRNGGKEMERLGANAASLGGVMSNNTVASLNSLKLAMADAGTAITGVGYRISGELAPALTSIAIAFADAMREGGLLRTMIDGLADNLERLGTYLAVAVTGFGVRYVGAMILAANWTGVFSGALIFLKGAIARTGIGLLVVGAGELVYWFAQLVGASSSFADGLARVYDVGEATFFGVGQTARGLMDIMAGVASAILGSFVRAFAEIAKAWDGVVNGMAMAWNALAESGIGEKIGLAPLAKSNIGGMAQAGADALFSQSASSIETGWNRIKNAGLGVRDAFNNALEPIESTTDALESGATAAERLSDELDKVGGSAGGAASKIPEVANATDTLSDAMQSFKSSAQSAFAGLVTGAKSAKQALADVLSSLANILANKAFESLFSGGGGGKGTGFWGKLFGFATGTPYAPGGMALVGERGPELVNLPRGSQVLNANQTRGVMGGRSNITFAPVIDARGADVGAVARIEGALARAHAEFESRVINTMHTAKKQRQWT